MPTQTHQNPPPFSIANYSLLITVKKAALSFSPTRLTKLKQAWLCVRSVVDYSLAKPFTFSAKEKDSETGLSVTSLREVSSLRLGNLRTSSHCTRSLRRFGSRYYNSDLSIWLSVDPMASKYPSFSPYTYCANNPIKLVDPNGEEVHPMGEEEYEMILNTLPQKDRAYVQLDKNGYIDKDLLNSHQSGSANYNGLCDLVNDNITYDVILDDTGFPYVDQEGSLKSQYPIYQEALPLLIDKEFKYLSGNTTGEGGILGLTAFPGLSCPANSPDSNVKIYINKKLSEVARAESFSHEGLGHALLYCLNGHNAYSAGHYSQSGQKDANTQLGDMIKSARKETYNNMHQ